jgi:hypothetical protein
MTENQAYVLDFVVGCLVTWGSVVLLSVLGVNEQLQFVAAMLGLCGGSFMVGVISVHYERKENGRGDDTRGD